MTSSIKNIKKEQSVHPKKVSSKDARKGTHPVGDPAATTPIANANANAMDDGVVIPSVASASRLASASATSSAPLENRAGAAEALLRKAESLVVTGHALTPKAKQRAHGLLRVPPEAIAIAIDVAERHPTRFPDFDVGAAKSALAVMTANAPLAQQCRDMAARIEESTLGVHSVAAEQALVVYGTMKALARLAKGESMLPQLRQMALLLRTRVKKKRVAKGAADAASPGKPTATQSPASPAINVIAPKPGASTLS